jgi:acetoin utilization deacetylase AcuC-like enzyme
MSPGSWDAAILAAGAVITAVDHVLPRTRLGDTAPAGRQDEASGDASGAAEVRAAFAMVRPPGHHALRDRAMGFCLLNNVAIGVSHALDRGLQRVAVVDYDVHHGNGTQWAFYDDPRVLVVSLHEHPFYPHTGSAGECGVGRGEGFTINVPLSAGAGDADYLLLLERVVEPVLRAYAPQLLVLDAGFDAHDRDPLAHMHVTTDGFRRMAGCLCEAAVRCCAGRIVAATEGGYHLEALRDSLQATVEVLAGESCGEPGASRSPTRSGLLALELVRRTQARYWPTL